MRGGRVLALSVLAAVVVAGCVSGPQGCVPPAVTAKVPADPPSTGGPAGITVTVAVEDSQGTPAAGADVFLFWNRDYIRPPEQEGDQVPTAPPLVVLHLRTDERGQATAGVPYDRYFIAQAGKPDSTQEFSALLFSGAADVRLDFTLYPSLMSFQADDIYPGPVAAPDVTSPPPGWRPSEFRLADLGPIEGIQERLVRLEAELAWNFSLGEQADLYLALGPTSTSAERSQGHGWAQPATPGPHRLRWVEERDLESRMPHWEPPIGSGSLWLGPGIDTGGLVALDGIAYEVSAHATLDLRVIREAECGVLFPDSAQEAYRSGDARHNPTDPPRTREPAFDIPAPAVGLVIVVVCAALVTRRRGV